MSTHHASPAPVAPNSAALAELLFGPSPARAPQMRGQACCRWCGYEMAPDTEGVWRDLDSSTVCPIERPGRHWPKLDEQAGQEVGA